VPAVLAVEVTENAPVASVVAANVWTAPPVGRNTRLTLAPLTPWSEPATTSRPEAVAPVAVRVRALGCSTGAAAGACEAALAVAEGAAVAAAVAVAEGEDEATAAPGAVVVVPPEPVDDEHALSTPAASPMPRTTAGIVRLFMVVLLELLSGGTPDGCLERDSWLV
jgi:hypothetical protein